MRDPQRDIWYARVTYWGLTLALLGCGDVDLGGGTAPPPPTIVIPRPAMTLPPRTDADRAWRLMDRWPELGLAFRHDGGREANLVSIVETLGSGAVLLDWDRDGCIDVLIGGGGAFEPAEKRYRARAPLCLRGLAGFQFQTCERAWLLVDQPLYPLGFSAADYDNDGWTDVLVAGYGRVQLWRNQGDGTFALMPKTFPELPDPEHAVAAWGDFDGDGVLDAYLVNYLKWSYEYQPDCRWGRLRPREICTPDAFPASTDVLLRGDGQGGFENRAEDVTGEIAGKGLAALVADVDGDGDVDLYVANDRSPNFLLRNHGDGKLAEQAHAEGVAMDRLGRMTGSMGLALLDANLDQHADWWVANFDREWHTLYCGRSDGTFADATRLMGVEDLGTTWVSFGSVAADFDTDGDEDLVVMSGDVRYPVEKNEPRQYPFLLENDQGNRLKRRLGMEGEFLEGLRLGRGLAMADLDADGDPDLVATGLNEPPAIVENRTEAKGAGYCLKLVGRSANRDAIGAICRFFSAKTVRWRQVYGGGSYLSTSDFALHVGLPAGEVLERIEVTWPGGETQSLDWPKGVMRATLCEQQPLVVHR